jgi:hypothetical protein
MARFWEYQDEDEYASRLANRLSEPYRRASSVTTARRQPQLQVLQRPQAPMPTMTRPSGLVMPSQQIAQPTGYQGPSLQGYSYEPSPSSTTHASSSPLTFGEMPYPVGQLPSWVNDLAAMMGAG